MRGLTFTSFGGGRLSFDLDLDTRDVEDDGDGLPFLLEIADLDDFLEGPLLGAIVTGSFV